MREFNEIDVARFEEMLYQNSLETDYDSKIYKIIENKHNLRLKKFKDSICLMRNSNFGECTEIINAHSIQNNGILDMLADNGYVADLDRLNIKNNDNFKKILVGKNEATVFRGFCKKHDEIFSEIEDKKYGVNKPLQNYLFAYRAFSKAYFNNVKASSIFENYITEWINSEELEKAYIKHSDIKISDKAAIDKGKK